MQNEPAAFVYCHVGCGVVGNEGGGEQGEVEEGAEG
jgi:hypothetical protein